MQDSALIMTGEASGDQYGAALARYLQARAPGLRLVGLGGRHLAAAHVELLVNMEQHAVMGFLPALAHLPELRKIAAHVETWVAKERPRWVLSIDYPGFNLRLQARLRKQTLRPWLCHWVAPQVWAWKPRRAKRIAHTLDRLWCLFPFEPPLFNRFSPVASCLGHPLLDLLAQDVPQQRDAVPLLLLAPGGRRREVLELLPLFVKAGRMVEERLRRHGRPVRLAIAKAPHVEEDAYAAACGIPLARDDYRTLCRRAHVAAIASGTATLEAALCGLPHVLAYRVDHAQAVLGRRLLRCPWVGLPNIVAQQEIVRELLQEGLRVERLAAALWELWEGAKRERQLQAFSRIFAQLGGGGALTRVGDQLLGLPERGLR